MASAFRVKSFCFRAISVTISDLPTSIKTYDWLESFAMYGAFLRSDYYDSPVLRVSHQPQLTQSLDRYTKFPRSQGLLFQLDLGFRYIPVQGESPYVFGLSSFRSLRPQQKCMAYTLLARGIHTLLDCFSSHNNMWDYPLPTSNFVA